MLSKVEILGSSSKGCCYLLYFDNNEIIQLDAGIDNKNSDKVNHLFISHNHVDHIKFLKTNKAKNTIQPINNPINKIYKEKEWFYTSFIVPHKVLNNGYNINFDNEKIGYITDCGDYSKININMSNLTYLFIECNWDYFLINQKIIKSQSHSIYAFSKEGHMSNLDCLNAIAKWKINKDCKIIFIHKSAQHANWDTTYKIFDSLPNKKYIAKKGDTLYCKSWKVI